MAKSSIFIDADAYIALNNSIDSNHLKSKKIENKLHSMDTILYTCTYVIAEVATVLSMRVNKKLGPQVVQEIIDDPYLSIVKGDKYIQQAISIMKKQTSKNVPFNDCIYFALSWDFEISYIFSFDKHWVKNGFKLL